MARKCEECTEWEYFEGYGYGCYYGQTMTPIDADKCDGYVLDNHDVRRQSNGRDWIGNKDTRGRVRNDS